MKPPIPEDVNRVPKDLSALSAPLVVALVLDSDIRLAEESLLVPSLPEAFSLLFARAELPLFDTEVDSAKSRTGCTGSSVGGPVVSHSTIGRVQRSISPGLKELGFLGTRGATRVTRGVRHRPTLLGAQVAGPSSRRGSPRQRTGPPAPAVPLSLGLRTDSAERIRSPAGAL